MNSTDTNHTTPAQKQLSFQDISHLFAQLDAQVVEQFYQSYQLWSQQQRSKQLEVQIATLQQQISENTAQMQQIQPSTLALVALAQLQASGVDDLDLLERMLDRGEEWLDHTMQLLELCQQLGVIQGNYTQWCEHALEGAYEWIESMYEASESPMTATEQSNEPPIEATEELMLQKLMSDSDDQPTIQTDIPLLTLPEDTLTLPEDTLSPESNTVTEQEELLADAFPPATEALLFEKLMNDSAKIASVHPPLDADGEQAVRNASTWYDAYDAYHEADLLADVTEEILFQKLMSDADVTATETQPETPGANSTWSDQDAARHATKATNTSNKFDQEHEVYIPDNIEILDLSVAAPMDTEAPPDPAQANPPEENTLIPTSDAEKAEYPTTSDEDSDTLFAAFPINLPTNKMPALKMPVSSEDIAKPTDQADAEKKTNSAGE